MSRPKVHLRHPDDPGLTWGCKLPVESPSWKSGKLRIASIDHGHATCVLCCRARDAAEPDEPAFEPTEPYAVPRAARELGEPDLAAIARSIAGSGERRYRWRSAVQALQELAVFRRDGQGVGSTSNPARFERLPRGASDPMGQVTGQVDRILGVDRARQRAFAAPREFAYTECECCGADRACDGRRSIPAGSVTLSVAQQVQVLDWSIEMRRVKGDPKPVALSLDTIIDRAADAWGIRLTERHITLVRSAGLRAVSAYLRAIGEMAPLEREAGKESEEMGEFDLRGWDDIEAHAKLSRKVIQRLAKRESDPFPLHELEGVRGYLAKSEEIDAWIERNVRPVKGAL